MDQFGLLCSHVVDLQQRTTEHREEIIAHQTSLVQNAQILGELTDRAAEVDFSLAGVSDNTARHGKAISALSEQQARTWKTLQAVVRAVQRLDGARARSPAATPRVCRASSTPGGFRKSEAAADAQAPRERPTRALPPELAEIQAVLRDHQGGVSDGARWCHAGGPVRATHMDLGSWPATQAFSATAGSEGFPRLDEFEEQEDLGSIVPPWDLEGENAMNCRGPPLPGARGSRSPAELGWGRTTPRSPRLGNGGGATLPSDVALCAQGVLSRIEEALSNLGGSGGAPSGAAIRASAEGTMHAGEDVCRGGAERGSEPPSFGADPWCDNSGRSSWAPPTRRPGSAPQARAYGRGPGWPSGDRDLPQMRAGGLVGEREAGLHWSTRSHSASDKNLSWLGGTAAAAS